MAERRVRSAETRQGRIGPIEWAIASRPLPGEDVCGDHAVALDAGGSALFGVVDGLGHGAEASAAARRAVDVLSDNPGEPVDVLMVLCHRALAETRGAALTVVVDPADRGDRGVVEVGWVGVGNVAAELIEVTPLGPGLRAEAPLAPGIVGYRLPDRLHSAAAPMRPGDLLIMASDGIRGDLVGAVDLTLSAEKIAAEVLAQRARASDDALVLAARHRGTPP